MKILIVILALLSLLVVLQGVRINKLEDDEVEFDDFLQDITDTLNQLIEERNEQENSTP